MPRDKNIFAFLFSLALHVAVWVLLSDLRFNFTIPLKSLKAPESVIYLKLIAPPRQELPKRITPDSAPFVGAPATQISNEKTAPRPLDRDRASMVAPAPPTAEEWAFASKYTNKNSKGYRYSWGQQVRSMMGTAVEGPNQGLVRFRIEIAPDGSLIQLQTLWTTSKVAEQLARQAIQNMPPLPPTPTGKSLIFDKTISFSPFANDGPPHYGDDCLPGPPMFKNPFAWDGKSPQVMGAPTLSENTSPQTLEECLRQLPENSIDAESARDQRLMDRWGSSKTDR